MSHSFAMTNETARPMRLGKAVVQVPCCSAVGTYPEVVAPGQTVSIPTQLSTGVKTGRKRVEFIVRTDSIEAPIWRLELIADLVAQREVELIKEDEGASRSDGRARRWLYRATTRHPAAARPVFAAAAMIAEPLHASLVGKPRVSDAVGGVIQVDQEIEVLAPPTTGFGRRSATLDVRFDDGSTDLAIVSWMVDDPICVTPSGLVLPKQGGTVTRSFVLTSSGEPVRITRIASDLIRRPAALAADNSHRHRFDLDLDPGPVAAGATVPITLQLDGPDRREITISVLVLDGQAGGMP